MTTQTRDLVDYIDQLSVAQNDAQKVSIIEAIGETQNPKAVGILVRSLQHASLSVLEAILDALGEIGDIRAVSPLLSYLRHPNEDISASAFSSLLKIGQQRASSIPNELAWQNQWVDPTSQMTQIAWQVDQEAIQVLQAQLYHPQSTTEVKIGVIYTLGHLGIVHNMGPIIQMMLNDSDEDIQAACAYALGEIALRASHVEVYRQVIQAFDQMLSQKTGTEVRVCIMRALADMEQQSTYQLLHLGLKDVNERVRQLAVMGLARLKSLLNLPILYEALKDSCVDVRRNAVYAIAYLKDPQSINVFLSAICDELQKGHLADVRTAVMTSLGQFNTNQAHRILRTALQEAHTEHQKMAIAYLLPHFQDAQALLYLLSVPEDKVRKTAALSLGHLKNHPQQKQVRNALETSLGDSAWEVRVACAQALKCLGDPLALACLQQRSNDPHTVVQTAVKNAIQSLAKLAQP
jgi:HEAT repeat protein